MKLLSEEEAIKRAQETINTESQFGSNQIKIKITDLNLNTIETGARLLLTLFVKSLIGEWEERGKVHLLNSAHPEVDASDFRYCSHLLLNYRFEHVQRLRFTIFKEKGAENEMLGAAYCQFSELFLSNMTLSLPIVKKEKKKKKEKSSS